MGNGNGAAKAAPFLFVAAHSADIGNSCPAKATATHLHFQVVF